MSIEAIGAALSGVRERLACAYTDTDAALARITDAADTLAELSRNHPDSLVPPQFLLACDRLLAGRELLASAIEATDRFAGML